MTHSEEYPQDAHDKASSAILNTLQDLIDNGTIPAGGRVNSYITIAETIDANGNSRVQVLWSDNRTHTLLGLLSYGQIMVSAGIAAPPEM